MMDAKPSQKHIVALRGPTDKTTPTQTCSVSSSSFFRICDWCARYTRPTSSALSRGKPAVGARKMGVGSEK